jgi:hypothetical protein
MIDYAAVILHLRRQRRRQRPTALWRQNASGRDLYGPSRVRQSALPLPRWIIDGPKKLRLAEPGLQKPSVGAGVIIEKGGWGRR